MASDQAFDYDQALLDPSPIFGTPEAVLTHPALDDRQRREILERWKLDAVRLADSANENMAGGEEPMLQRVNDALLEAKRRTGEES